MEGWKFELPLENEGKSDRDRKFALQQVPSLTMLTDQRVFSKGYDLQKACIEYFYTPIIL